MVFNSIEFLFFFPITCMFYFLLPQKKRYVGLLLISYYFCMCWGSDFVGWLFVSTVITYIAAWLIEIIKQKEKIEPHKKSCYKKVTLGCGIGLNLLMLIYFKYLDFFGSIIEIVLSRINMTVSIPKFEVLLPIGMSFYVFQGIGYMIDVYRNEVHAQRNFLKHALFLAFFPRLISGPIERSKNLMKQIEQPTQFDIENVRVGLLTFAWGLFLKLVVADRIANIINPVFDNYSEYHAMSYFVVIVMYAFQVYFDFEGYSLMAIGCANVLGFHLKENFSSPYFALSVPEFWRRWHISLTSWFRDYLYIPLGGNRRGKACKYLNTMIVFTTSGLWHGAGWNYIIWGALNGGYIVCHDITKKWRLKISERFSVNTSGIAFQWIARVFTFILIDFSWIFFRVETLGKVSDMFSMMFRDFDMLQFLKVTFWGSFVTAENLAFIVLLVIVALIVDYLKYKNINVVEKILKQKNLVRWVIYYIVLFVIILAGAYGEGYEQTKFIYFQF